ncbi:hypothetical protein N7G274_007074 [Stereocaulon virgatum]|uniref:DUF6594 domain-containing protein n=1 Tax=Stereocaulon virgatum TaxID=373712 RepID=A0ABR4A5F7_9LECA
MSSLDSAVSKATDIESDFNSVRDPKHSFWYRLLRYYGRMATPTGASHLDPHHEEKEPSERWERLEQQVQHYPPGLPSLAAYLNGDKDRLIARKFGYLHARVLLDLERDLETLEANLRKFDQADSETNPAALQSRDTDEERLEGKSRGNLLQEVNRKLVDYHNVVVRIKAFQSMSIPTPQAFNHWGKHIKDKIEVVDQEKVFLQRAADLVTLADVEEQGWLDRVVERALNRCSPKDNDATSIEERNIDERFISIQREQRVEKLVRLMVTLSTVGLLMLPTTVLYLLPSRHIVRMIIVLLFTFLFSTAISVLTKAKRHEMFAASAAYTAVLVVFLSNLPTT